MGGSIFTLVTWIPDTFMFRFLVLLEVLQKDSSVFTLVTKIPNTFMLGFLVSLEVS